MPSNSRGARNAKREQLESAVARERHNRNVVMDEIAATERIAAKLRAKYKSANSALDTAQRRLNEFNVAWNERQIPDEDGAL